MIRQALTLVVATSIGLPVTSSAQVSGLPGRWVEREFVDPEGVDVAAANAFLNQECRPSDLTGIATFAVQAGHDEPLRLHIACRQDHARRVGYHLTAERFDRGQYGQALAAALRDRAHVGPFFFGLNGAWDGLVIIRPGR